MPIRNRRNEFPRSLQLKQAVLAVFLQHASSIGRLEGFTETDWARAMRWLDISGMALYFLDEIRRKNIEQLVPQSILTELETRMARNRERTIVLGREASSLSRCLEAAGVPYALLKGVSLVPDSVPNAALRWQTDLDFLVARTGLRRARETVSRVGYGLHADTGSVLEFRLGRTGKPDLAKIYSAQCQRALELHVTEDHSALLARRCIRELGSARVATLSPPDILVQQALHLLKHLCGEHTRLSWVFEFRRHAQARREDTAFWSAAEEIAAQERHGDIAMAVAVWLARANFGWTGVEPPQRWSEEHLPEGVLLWLRLYSGELLLGDSVASKLYALLRKELPSRQGENKSTRSILIPSRLPLPITTPAPQETSRERVKRYFVELRHLTSRVRFHAVEGIRFGIEASRWKRELAKLRKTTPASTGLIPLLVLGLWTTSPRCYSQSIVNPPAPQENPADSRGQSPVDRQNPATNDTYQAEQQRDAPRTAMPAADLIRFLRANPDAMVEVKSLVADTMQQGDLPVDSITDDQVYTRIESSLQIRKTLTQFLRARGYLTEQQIEAAESRGRALPSLNAERAIEEDDLAEMAQGDLPQIGADSRLNSIADADALRRRSGIRSSVGERGLQPSRDLSRGEPNLTDEPQVMRQPTPYNLRSLRDLYTQVPDASEPLKRFGSDVFTIRGSVRNASLPPEWYFGSGDLEVPLGPDYVLGPGDELNISMWGGVSQSFLRRIDSEGGIALPEAGVVQLAGLTLEKAQSVIQHALQLQYRDTHSVVTVARLRSIRIFVAGDVRRPGSYEVSSLASPVSALFAAGGPTAVGSLRILKHFRNEKQIGEIDLYDFMLHGIRSDRDRLQSGDTLLVPPVGPQVAVFGAVKRPAIYELRAEKNLADVLDDAGGLTVAAAITHIAVERIVANQGREEIGIDADVNEKPGIARENLAAFAVQDGDRVHVATVLPANERVLYIQGHVARPGRIAYRDNMHLSDVLRSYGDLLPEPADTGEIIRLVAPDMHPETFDFNLPDVLIGNSSPALQAFDTIRIFGRYEQDAPMVGIRGEVARPGSYPLFEGMTAAQLVRAAGGFKRDALLNRADLTTYRVENGARVTVCRRDIAIGSAVLKGDRDADVPLKPGDVLTIHQLTGWDDIGASIVIEGEVAHPGSYGFQEGEHLSDLLKRAGGFRATAYPEGAVLTRPEVKALEEQSREELIRQIETSSAAARMSPGIAPNDAQATLQVIQQQQDQVIAELKSTPATGRLVIHIGDDIGTWAGAAADIEVRRGDELKIPKRPGFVLVSGQVYNASAIAFTPDKAAKWYLQRAGGATQIANRKTIFIVRANGEVIGPRSGAWHMGDVLSTRLKAGDTVVVPQKIVGASLVWRNLLATAQVAASVAIAAAVVGL